MPNSANLPSRRNPFSWQLNSGYRWKSCSHPSHSSSTTSTLSRSKRKIPEPQRRLRWQQLLQDRWPHWRLQALSGSAGQPWLLLMRLYASSNRPCTSQSTLSLSHLPLPPPFFQHNHLLHNPLLPFLLYWISVHISFSSFFPQTSSPDP